MSNITSKPEYSCETIVEALKDVIDPELGVNLVDLGLIYRVELTDTIIEVDMTLTTPGCPMAELLTAAVENRIQALGFNIPVEVNVVWEPSWTPDNISDEGKKQLGNR